MPRFAAVLAFLGLSLVARESAAHITLIDPPPRTEQQKSGPCGAGPDDGRGDVITTYKPGETITLRWMETVNHPGHYRISFDADGQDDFADPAAYDDFDSNDAVLVDAIMDANGGMYEQQITLPNIECDNCTIQLAQMMTDKPPYGDGNDLYYQCADIVIMGVAAGTTTGGDETTGVGSTAGEETTGGGSAGSTGGHVTHGEDTGTPDPTSGGDATTGGGTAGIDTTGGGTTGGSSGGDTAGDPGEGEGGCGCRSGSGGAGGLLALVVLGAARRRRRGA